MNRRRDPLRRRPLYAPRLHPQVPEVAQDAYAHSPNAFRRYNVVYPDDPGQPIGEMNLYQRPTRPDIDDLPPRVARQRRPIPDPRLHGARQARDRNDIVNIIFPHGRQYAVRRAHLTHLLTRAAANAPLLQDRVHINTLLTGDVRRRFPPEFDADLSLDLALETLFDGLERMAHGEEPVDLFHDVEFFRLDDYTDPVSVERSVGIVFALCVVLDVDRELGCSDQLAEHIGQFMVELLQWLRHDPDREWADNMAGIVMSGYMKVFRRTMGSLVVLEQLWALLSEAAREDVVWSLRHQAGIRGERSDAQRMLGAMIHLRLEI